MKEKDISVEIMRIIASFFVVAVHCLLNYIRPDGVPDKSLTLIAAFVADGVGVFWLISGLFAFRKSNQKKNLLHMAKRIIVPVVGYMVFISLFQGVLLKDESISLSVCNGISNMKNLVQALALFDYAMVPYSGHLWFVSVYILIILIIPIISGVENIDEKNWYTCVIGIAILFILNDIMLGKTLIFSHHGINAAFPASIIMLLGSKLYEKKEKLISKIEMHRGMIACICIALFLLISLIRTFLVLKTRNRHFLFWYSGFGVVMPVCIFCFCNCFIIKSDKIRTLITFVGGRTFSIYVLHILVMQVLNKWFDLQNKLVETVLHGGVLGEFTYTGVFTCVIWFCTLILVVILHCFTVLIERQIIKLRKYKTIVLHK